MNYTWTVFTETLVNKVVRIWCAVSSTVCLCPLGSWLLNKSVQVLKVCWKCIKARYKHCKRNVITDATKHTETTRMAAVQHGGHSRQIRKTSFTGSALRQPPKAQLAQ